jgi:hypothetical protein
MGTLTNVTYKIKNLSPTDDLAGHTQYVRSAFWVAIGTDGTHTVTQEGASAFDLEPQANFIPFGNLTEETVTGWIRAQRGMEEHINEVLQKKLDEKSGVVSVETSGDLPWSA